MNDFQLPPLPAEILSQIFLEVDPHTLYTSIRCLSKEWRKQVEENLLRLEFTSNRWRVGLRITRKAKKGQAWRGGIVGQEGEFAPGAAWIRIRDEVNEEYENINQEELHQAMQQAQEAYTQSVLSRQGAREDELPSELMRNASSVLTHVLPLDFKAYNGESAMLQFGTASADWYAMFENALQEGEDNSSRLDLDFSIVWRFPGDGQGECGGDGWGIPDQENGWLSRFYCSKFDTSTAAATSQEDDELKVLHTTPLARRVRKRTVTLQPEFQHPELSPSTSTLDWSDEGHEYMSLGLSLGTEFFVRRSAQANFLMRRLEKEAEAGERRFRDGSSSRSSRVSSVAPTPRRDVNTTSSSSSRREGKSIADPVARLQRGKSSMSSPSGICTPTRSFSASGPSSYASVASTPTSSCSSPRGSLLPMRLKGLPRIAKIQRDLLHPGNRALFPSANTSGYTSVKHQSQIQDKEKDKEAESFTASSSLPSSPRQDNAGSSSHGSIPRACFSAQLLVSPVASPLRWRPGSSLSDNSSSRKAILKSSSSPLTIWEWSR